MKTLHFRVWLNSYRIYLSRSGDLLAMLGNAVIILFVKLSVAVVSEKLIPSQTG